MKKESITVSGKRKRAVARAKIKKGDGKVKINHLPYENLEFLKKLLIKEPIEITKEIMPFDFDVEISVRGGGNQSRIQAARLALARSLVAFTGSKELRNAFLNYDKNLLIGDVRRKETYKPGDSKARRKRQKSYR